MEISSELIKIFISDNDYLSIYSKEDRLIAIKTGLYSKLFKNEFHPIMIYGIDYDIAHTISKKYFAENKNIDISSELVKSIDFKTIDEIEQNFLANI